MAERTVRDLVTQIGMEKIMNRLDIKPGMIRHMVRENTMPPKYYAAVRDMAEAVGVPTPEDRLFSFDPQPDAKTQ